MVIANAILCGILVYLCLCRITKMTVQTRRSIRYGVSALLGAASFAGMVPFTWQSPVQWPQLVLAGAMVFYLISCRRVWVDGTPASPHN